MGLSIHGFRWLAVERLVQVVADGWGGNGIDGGESGVNLSGCFTRPALAVLAWLDAGDNSAHQTFSRTDERIDQGLVVIDCANDEFGIDFGVNTRS